MTPFPPSHRNNLLNAKNSVIKKPKLEIFDQQMFDILELAGESIFQNPMIENHSIALAKANMASETLYQKLQELKVTLQENEGSF